MNRDLFNEEIKRIFKIALIQKTIQMLLRAAWVGGGVYLLMWGLNRLFGWFQNSQIWGIISALIFLLILGSVFLNSQISKKFVWRLDQGYSLQQQVYTLFEIFQYGDGEVEKQPVVKELIESKTIAQLPKVRRAVVDQGWRVREEFEAAAVILILLMIAYLNSVSAMVRIPESPEGNILPVLGVDPAADHVFVDGIPGNLPSVGDTQGFLGGALGISLAGLSDISTMDWTIISEEMQKLGDQLQTEASTYELGHALVQENYDEAANQFGTLAENVDKINPNVQTWIANQFLDTAVNLQNLQQRSIPNYFQEASAALYEGSETRIAEKLDDLAGLMDFFSQTQRGETRADLPIDSQIADQQSLEQYQESVLIIEEFPEMQDYVSAPAGETQNGAEYLDESVDFIMPFDRSVIEGIWFPFQFSMEDSDVVSSYFSPR